MESVTWETEDFSMFSQAVQRCGVGRVETVLFTITSMSVRPNGGRVLHPSWLITALQP